MDRIVAPFPVSHWTSLGYSQVCALEMRHLNRVLIGEITRLNWTSDLNQLSETAEVTTTSIRIGIADDAANALPERSLLPDASLLPLWKEFADVLVKLATKERVLLSLTIKNIQLSTQVLSILEPALKVAPLEQFWLENNRLGSEGINFVTSVLEANHSLSKLILWGNEIECGHGALSLVEATRNHPRLQGHCLRDCGISRILRITPEIVPALLSLKVVGLSGSDLGSHAASLISNCLATNPSIKALNLRYNLFNDEDARLFANSLMTNTNLDRLWLGRNNFTDAGFKTLYKSVYDEQSPNAIYDSNHTCQLILFDKGAQILAGIDEAVLSMNDKMFDLDIFSDSLIDRCDEAAHGDYDALELLEIEGRKKVKVLHAIQGGNAGRFNMQWIEDIPVELMPNVFVFLQESGKYAGTEERNLDRLFQVARARQEVTSFYSVPEEGCYSQQQHKRRRL